MMIKAWCRRCLVDAEKIAGNLPFGQWARAIPAVRHRKTWREFASRAAMQACLWMISISYSRSAAASTGGRRAAVQAVWCVALPRRTKP